MLADKSSKLTYLTWKRLFPLTGVVLMLLHILLFSMLSGCGFHLRGAVELPAAMTEVAIQGTKPYGELGVALRNGFARVGGEVVESVQQAQSVLVITRDTSQRRVLSVDSSGQANQYELEYTLGFRLDDPEGVTRVVGQSIQLRRHYTYNPNQALAKADEEARLVREMREEAVRQMLLRLKASLEKSVSVKQEINSRATPS